MKEHLKKILFVLLILTAGVYFAWRLTDTFPLGSVPGMTAAVILLATELTGTAEMLVLGLPRGDLDWRSIVNPSTRPIA